MKTTDQATVGGKSHPIQLNLPRRLDSENRNSSSSSGNNSKRIHDHEDEMEDEYEKGYHDGGNEE